MKKQSIFNGEIGQRFSLRKYRAIGLTSVALGSFWLGLAKTNENVHADTTNNGADSAKVAAEDHIAGAAQDQAKTDGQAADTQTAQTVTSQESVQAKAQADTTKADAVSTGAGFASMQADAKSTKQDLTVTNLG